MITLRLMAKGNLKCCQYDQTYNINNAHSSPYYTNMQSTPVYIKVKVVLQARPYALHYHLRCIKYCQMRGNKLLIEMLRMYLSYKCFLLNRM